MTTGWSWALSSKGDNVSHPTTHSPIVWLNFEKEIVSREDTFDTMTLDGDTTKQEQVCSLNTLVLDSKAQDVLVCVSFVFGWEFGQCSKQIIGYILMWHRGQR